ncbi:MAG: hypothetical protein IKZ55_07460 [Bacteroidales bacterium]|nr:hypothetical protein [Bacteroidales bacterium]
MKKLFLYTSMALVLFCSSCVRRTPERLLRLQFGIDLSDFDYTVESVDDKWYSPHGEGHCRVVYAFHNLSQQNINDVIRAGAKEFPIPDTIPKCGRMRKEVQGDNHYGYYIFFENEDDTDEFKYFILDLTAKRAILYYQVM